MDAVYRLERATAAEIRENMPSPPSISAVRRMVAILEEKGYLNHEWQGPRYVFSATIPREQARKEAIRRITDTFFDGSPVRAVATMIDLSASELSDEDFETLSELLKKAHKEGR